MDEQQKATELQGNPDADGFAPVDLSTYKWQPGSVFQIQTKMHFDWCPITYNLKIVKPVTFKELNVLVHNAIKSSGEDIFKHLFALWFQSLSPVGLIDKESFKAIMAEAQKQKEAQDKGGKEK